MYTNTAPFWIAKRTVKYNNLGKVSDIVICMAAPEVDIERDWRCDIVIAVEGQEEAYSAFGIDAFQSIQLGFERIRHELDQLPGKTIWLGSTDIQGFPRFVPQCFGMEFSEKVDNYIDQEIEEFSKCASQTHRTNKT